MYRRPAVFFSLVFRGEGGVSTTTSSAFAAALAVGLCSTWFIVCGQTAWGCCLPSPCTNTDQGYVAMAKDVARLLHRLGHSYVQLAVVYWQLLPCARGGVGGWWL